MQRHNRFPPNPCAERLMYRHVKVYVYVTMHHFHFPGDANDIPEEPIRSAGPTDPALNKPCSCEPVGTNTYKSVHPVMKKLIAATALPSKSNYSYK